VVVAPGTVADAKGMLKAAIRQDDPVVYFEHKKLYRSIKEDLPDDTDFVTDLFKAAIRRPGKDLTLVTYGWTLQLSLQAAEKIHAESGAEIEVVDLRVLNPLDKDTFLESLAKTGRLLIVHEDHRTLGIGAEISAIAAEQAFDCLDAPILRVTAPDVPAIPFSAPLEKFYLPSVDAIVAAATRLLHY
jgi:2-oxoisovalerate dehydrogenase E1 component beta subunit